MYYQFNSTLVDMLRQPFVKQLFYCKDFTDSDRLLGVSKGRGITWFLNTTTELGVDSVLRHYYRGGLFGKIIKDYYWFRSFTQTRAVQEFALLTQLNQWGLPVPRPIAVAVKKQCCWYQADILLEKIANTQDLSQFLIKNTLDNAKYQQIGRLIRQLHNHQVHHSDLNIHNILRDNQGKFWLIDFDKCRVDQNEHWKQENLNRLLRSFHKEQKRLKIQFSEQNWQALLEGYWE